MRRYPRRPAWRHGFLRGRYPSAGRTADSRAIHDWYNSRQAGQDVACLRPLRWCIGFRDAPLLDLCGDPVGILWVLLVGQHKAHFMVGGVTQNQREACAQLGDPPPPTSALNGVEMLAEVLTKHRVIEIRHAYDPSPSACSSHPSRQVATARSRQAGQVACGSTGTGVAKARTGPSATWRVPTTSTAGQAASGNGWRYSVYVMGYSGM